MAARDRRRRVLSSAALLCFISLCSCFSMGAFSPKRAGTATQYITVHVDDIDAHHQRALASGAEIVSRLHDHLRDYRVYEALDLEGHRWRFLQWLREVPQ